MPFHLKKGIGLSPNTGAHTYFITESRGTLLNKDPPALPVSGFNYLII